MIGQRDIQDKLGIIWQSERQSRALGRETAFVSIDTTTEMDVTLTATTVLYVRPEGDTTVLAVDYIWKRQVNVLGGASSKDGMTALIYY